MKRSSFLLVLLFSMIVPFCPVQAYKGKGKIQDQIDNILQWESKFGFSGSVLVVKDGRVILSKGYGLANKDQVFANTSKTAFYIASVSKPITALAVMKLVEEKKISLADPVTKYFPNVPDNKKAITVEMLLTHMSGFEHTYSCDNISDRDKAIDMIFSKTPVVAAPGAKYNYSGDNYTLLAAIIEIVSGRRFESYITANILEPAGISTPAFAGNLQLLKDDDIAAPADNSLYKNMKDIAGTWGRKGRAGMILSVEDLYKLDLALEGNRIFRTNIIDDILSPKIKNITGANYGYGFSVSNTMRGTKVFGHGGDDDGVGHNFSYLDFPDEHVKIFIGSNSGLYSGSSWSTVISSLLQRFLFTSNYTYPGDKLFYNEFRKDVVEDLEKLEGVYQSGNTNYHVWLNNKQQLIVCPIGDEVAGSFGFPAAYSSKNMLSASILRETHDQQYALLETHSSDAASFERLKKTFSSFWQSLEKRNGPLEKIEILGTANIWGGNLHADIASWCKLVFKNRTQVYRLEWDVNNKIAGLGGSAIRYPMMFTLNAIAKNEFIGFDPANGRTLAVNFLATDRDNKNILELNIGENKPVLLYNTGDLNLLPRRSAAELLYRVITTKGIEAAIKEVAIIKEKKLNRFDLDEDGLNELGYTLLKEKKMNEAIAIFTLLVQEYPDSANGFDSLGEAYMKAGNKTEAIKNFKRSLELDPKNENAKTMIGLLSN